MNINIVNDQIYHNIKIGSKSIDFSDINVENNNIDLWKQIIIYSFLNLYQIKYKNIDTKETFKKLLNGEDINYITYKEFNNLLYNAFVGMNFMLDDINETQFKALEDFLNKNQNIIGNCFATKKIEIDSNPKVLNKNLKYDNIKL